MLVLASCTTSTTQQETHYTLKNTELVQMKSDLTGREYELVINLPGSYADSTNKRYPVLYYLDAYWDTPLLSSIHGQLVYDNVIPELIMVGLSYPGENVNYGAERAIDLSPTQMPNSNLGGGPQFLKFIETAVIPFMDAKYRTQPSERTLSGSSMGGLFTLYVMYEKPLLFKRYIAISPHTGWDNDYVARRDDAYAEIHTVLPARLFLSTGSDEYPPFRNPTVAYQKKLADRHYQDLGLLNYTIEGERHSGVKAEGYSRGLRWVYKDIAPIGPSGLEREITGGH